MGFLDKIKNALFEEEEIEVPVKEDTRELERQRLDEDKRKIEREKEEDNQIRIREIKLPQPDEPKIEKEVSSSFRSEKTFEFPIFDEEEFKDSKSRTNRNVLEYEKRAKIEKRLDFNKSEEPEVKKFKPSPIISPVYGMIEGELRREDVLPKPAKKEEIKRVIDVDAVRNKAFGTLEDEIERTLIDNVNEFYKEEGTTKSIDELLTESADSTISVEEVLDEIIGNTESISDIRNDEALYEVDVPMELENISVPNFDLKDELETLLEEDSANVSYEIDRKTPVLEVLDEIDNSQNKDDKINETLESDLFNLIDSMYETRKDEE